MLTREQSFIHYLYFNGTLPGARKRLKKCTCADFCEVGPKEGVMKQFFDHRLAAAVKAKDLQARTFFPSF